MTDLQRRALSGLLRFQTMLGLLLFVPAWSLRYWQAWVFWVLIGASSLAITLYFLGRDPALIERRLRGGPAAEHSLFQKVVVALVGVLSSGVAVVPGIEHRLRTSSVPAAASLAADAVILVGFYLAYLVFRANSHASSVVEVREGQPVIDTGPYSLVRHPLYSAALLIILATPVALGSLRAEVFAVPLAGLIVARLVDEERYLVVNLPGYAAYRSKVPHRLVPHVW